ncbi:PPIC-type PPIASE domain protein [Prevotella sp. DNF00663]|nr:PPIC-type PPIASE domain protein [Prevotella sp. DNF00663]
MKLQTILASNKLMVRTPSALLLVGILLMGSISFGQTVDPVVMTINGKAVTRSEFEYSYNKDNAAGVLDKKTVEEYLPLFVNFKLKVEAALDARLDTLASFQNELASYRSGLMASMRVSNTDMEAAARSLYEADKVQAIRNGGLYRVAQIYLHVGQREPRSAEMVARARIDSIYRALQQGADFGMLARRCSDDKVTAARGGELHWVQRGETMAEFEAEMSALKVGEMSKPFESPAGFHIIKLLEKCDYLPYEAVRTELLKTVERQNVLRRMKGMNSQLVAEKRQMNMDSMSRENQMTLEEMLPEQLYLLQEYREGLLLYNMCSRTVWDSAARDEAGLEHYFRQNKKKYRWGQPRYKGIVYYAKTKKDLSAVKKLLKSTDSKEWMRAIKRTFQENGGVSVQAEQALFKPDDNALIDSKVFGYVDGKSALKDGYPYMAVYGKKLKVPKSMDDVRYLVVADYQEELEKAWVEGLRKKYTVSIDRDVLLTVNKH